VLLFLLPMAWAQGLCGIDVALSYPTTLAAGEVDGGVEATLYAMMSINKAVVNAPLVVVEFDRAANVNDTFVVYTNGSGQVFIPSEGGSSYYFIFPGAGEGVDRDCILRSYLSSVEGFQEWWESQGRDFDTISLSQIRREGLPSGPEQLEDGTPLESVSLLPSATLTFTTANPLEGASSLPPELCLPLAALLGVALASFFARGINPFFWMGLRVRVVKKPLEYRGSFKRVTKKTGVVGRVKEGIERAASVGSALREGAQELGGGEGSGWVKGMEKVSNLLMKPYEMVVRFPTKMVRKATVSVVKKLGGEKVVAEVAHSLERPGKKGRVEGGALTKLLSMGVASVLWSALRALGIDVGGPGYITAAAGEIEEEVARQVVEEDILPTLSGARGQELEMGVQLVGEGMVVNCNEECLEKMLKACEGDPECEKRVREAGLSKDGVEEILLSCKGGECTCTGNCEKVKALIESGGGIVSFSGDEKTLTYTYQIDTNRDKKPDATAVITTSRDGLTKEVKEAKEAVENAKKVLSGEMEGNVAAAAQTLLDLEREGLITLDDKLRERLEEISSGSSESATLSGEDLDSRIHVSSVEELEGWVNKHFTAVIPKDFEDLEHLKKKVAIEVSIAERKVNENLNIIKEGKGGKDKSVEAAKEILKMEEQGLVELDGKTREILKKVAEGTVADGGKLSPNKVKVKTVDEVVEERLPKMDFLSLSNLPPVLARNTSINIERDGEKEVKISGKEMENVAEFAGKAVKGASMEDLHNLGLSADLSYLFRHSTPYDQKRILSEAIKEGALDHFYEKHMEEVEESNLLEDEDATGMDKLRAYKEMLEEYGRLMEDGVWDKKDSEALERKADELGVNLEEFLRLAKDTPWVYHGVIEERDGSLALTTEKIDLREDPRVRELAESQVREQLRRTYPFLPSSFTVDKELVDAQVKGIIQRSAYAHAFPIYEKIAHLSRRAAEVMKEVWNLPSTYTGVSAWWRAVEDARKKAEQGVLPDLIYRETPDGAPILGVKVGTGYNYYYWNRREGKFTPFTEKDAGQRAQIIKETVEKRKRKLEEKVKREEEVWKKGGEASAATSSPGGGSSAPALLQRVIAIKGEVEEKISNAEGEEKKKLEREKKRLEGLEGEIRQLSGSVSRISRMISNPQAYAGIPVPPDALKNDRWKELSKPFKPLESWAKETFSSLVWKGAEELQQETLGEGEGPGAGGAGGQSPGGEGETGRRGQGTSQRERHLRQEPEEGGAKKKPKKAKSNKKRDKPKAKP